jgi:hypothetical protein
MPRKSSKGSKYPQPSLPIVKLDNVPGPEDDVGALRAHYQQVQNAFATHRYDDVIQACHWCLDMEAGLGYSKTDETRGTRMFCSGRCASAYCAYQVKVLHCDKKAQQQARPPEDEGDDPADDASEAPPEPAPEPEANPAEAGRADWAKRVSEQTLTGRRRRVKDVTTVVGKEGTGKTTARKPRAGKPKRTDDKCPKGLHEMTPENRYEYKGTVWCRECRKASRAKSKNGGSK